MSFSLNQVFRDGLQALLNSGEHSDLVLRCEFGETFKEGQDGVVDIAIGDSPTISALVKFMYTLDYEDNTNDGRLLCNVKMNEAADYYDLPHLSELAIQKFMDALAAYWSIEDFIKAIQYIYTSSDAANTPMKDLLIDSAVVHAEELVADTTFTDMLLELPALSRDLTVLSLPEHSKFNGYIKYGCLNTGCGFEWATGVSQSKCPMCYSTIFEEIE